MWVVRLGSAYVGDERMPWFVVRDGPYLHPRCDGRGEMLQSPAYASHQRERGIPALRQVRDRLRTLGEDAEGCIGAGAIQQATYGRPDIRARGQVGATHDLIRK